MPVAAEPRRVGTVALTVDGKPLSAHLYDLLLDARVEQSLHAPDRFSLRFRDPHFELIGSEPPTFAIGQRLDVDLAADGPEVAVLTRAEITSVVVEQSPGGRHELVVVGCDRRARLAGAHRVRVFLQHSDLQIVEEIARDHGLTVAGSLKGASRPYVLQVGTDYAMVDQCVARAGAMWRVEGSELRITAPPAPSASQVLAWGEDLHRFRVRCSAAEWASEITVRSWDPVNQRAVVGRVDLAADKDRLPLGTDASGVRQQFKAAAKALPTRRIDNAAPACDEVTAGALARWLAERTSRAFVAARGEALGDPTLQPGTRVRLEGVGAQLTGDWELTTVEHVMGAEQPYTTRFTCGGDHAASFLDLLGEATGNGVPGPARGGWGGGGVVIGVVTNVSDPDRLGRVKVSFPTLGDHVESTWARVAAPGAGKEQGLSVPYDPGDEVVVTFEHGGIDGAVVLGGLWSPPHAPPPTIIEDGRAASDAWRSRSGHIIEMLDAQGTASTSSGHVSIRLRDDQTRFDLVEDRVELASPSPTTIQSDKTITLRAQGNLVIDAANVTIKGKGKIELQAPVVEAKASARVSVEGAVADVKGTGSASLQGGSVRVSGGTVSLG